MMDWTKHTTDPCNPKIQIKIQNHLESIRMIAKEDFMTWLLKRLKNKSCLDIGAIEHDLSYTEKPSWKHKQITNVASRTVGVDILEEYVHVLNERGFDMRFCDATSDQYLGEKFNTVVVGDVIEHVENPINLIRFSIRHLEESGEVIVKTPNPFYIDNVIKFAKNKHFINFEHLAWFTPTMALEIARRAECVLKSYVVFPRKRPWPKIFPKSDMLTRDFVYILTRNKYLKETK